MEEVDKADKKEQGTPLLLRLLFTKVRIPLDIIVLLVGLSVAGTAYTMVKVPQLSIFINPQIDAQNESSKLVEDVSGLISLPDDEKPLVVTLFDTEGLSAEPLFKEAQNGDKVLLFTKSHKAILYRPSENLIIEVGTVRVGE